MPPTRVRKRVLVACEYSGRVRDAFISKGCDAWSCDLLQSESNKGPHYQCDVKDVLKQRWDLLIAHPPCTYLCNSGVRWLYGGKGSIRDERRWALMEIGAEFFKMLLNAPIKCVAVENPIMHGFAKNIVGRGPDQTIQPWMFGHGETKATCLWLKNLPQLSPTNIVNGREQKVSLTAPGPDRWKIRSLTYQGIADAMADQWSKII